MYVGLNVTVTVDVTVDVRDLMSELYFEIDKHLYALCVFKVV